MTFISEQRIKPFNAQEDTGGPFHRNFNSIFKKGSSKKFPMNVAPMSL